jgi:hypothetical protein
VGEDEFHDVTPAGNFYFSGEYDLNISYFAVPAYANVVFQVSTLWRSHILGGGGILADFANNEFDNKIICPSVQLELYGPASG